MDARILETLKSIPREDLKKLLIVNGLDLEILRLLDKVPDDDLKDLLAIHGAGTFQRQAQAHLKRYFAQNWGGVAIAAFLLGSFALGFLWLATMNMR